MMTQKQQSKKRAAAGMAVLAAIFCLTAAPASADVKGDAEKTSVVENAIVTERATIVEKTADAVVAGTGERYRISEASIIIARDGRQEDYKTWRVPCDGMLTYGIDADGTKLVHRFEVLNTRKQATSNVRGLGG